MNHFTEKNINDFLDGSHSAFESNELREHLSVCFECREKFAAFELVHQNLLRLETYSAPETLNSFVLGRILSSNKSTVSHKKFFISIFSAFGLLISFLFWFLVDEISNVNELGKSVSLFDEYQHQLKTLMNKLPIIHSIRMDNFTVAALFLFMIVAGLFFLYEKMQDVKKAV